MRAALRAAQTLDFFNKLGTCSFRRIFIRQALKGVA
jgi:hypothetical protein